MAWQVSDIYCFFYSLRNWWSIAVYAGWFIREGVLLASDFWRKERLKQNHLWINLWSCCCAGLARVTPLQQWLVVAVGGEGCFCGEGRAHGDAWKESCWCPGMTPRSHSDVQDSQELVLLWVDGAKGSVKFFLAFCPLVRNAWLVIPGVVGVRRWGLDSKAGRDRAGAVRAGVICAFYGETLGFHTLAFAEREWLLSS